MSDNPLLDQAATLFASITLQLNDLIMTCRRANCFDAPDLTARRRRLERARRRAYWRWYRRGGALHAPDEDDDPAPWDDRHINGPYSEFSEDTR